MNTAERIGEVVDALIAAVARTPPMLSQRQEWEFFAAENELGESRLEESGAAERLAELSEDKRRQVHTLATILASLSEPIESAEAEDADDDIGLEIEGLRPEDQRDNLTAASVTVIRGVESAQPIRENSEPLLRFKQETES